MLETKDLILRRAVFDDWKAMYENVWRHPETAKYMLWDVTTSEADARSRMERTIVFQSTYPGAFTVAERMTGQAIGFAGLREIAPGVWEETGIALGPAFTGKGYGKQILTALVNYAFREKGGQRFLYACRSGNAASIALQRSCGFSYTHSEERIDPRNGEGYTLNFYEKRRNDMEVKISYHGHACFTLEHQGVRAVIDPYAWGMIPGAQDLHLEAEAVYCSHDHGDHNFVQAVKVNEGTPLPWTVTEFTTPHDDCDGAMRGMNTVRIFDFGGIRVAHLGDIGCFPDEELAEALEGIDCMLIPVGGYYTIGCQTAYQIIRAANPKVAIPMHYRTDKVGFDEISHIDDFCKLWNEVKTKDSPFVLDHNSEKQILVLNTKGE